MRQKEIGVCASEHHDPDIRIGFESSYQFLQLADGNHINEINAELCSFAFLLPAVWVGRIEPRG
jgi:hypothetical protein